MSLGARRGSPGVAIVEAREKAERIIDYASDERARLLLFYRFILGYPWDKIQKRLGIAASQVHCIKRGALRAVAAYR